MILYKVQNQLRSQSSRRRDARKKTTPLDCALSSALAEDANLVIQWARNVDVNL